jgi:hypothetical protein
MLQPYNPEVNQEDEKVIKSTIQIQIEEEEKIIEHASQISTKVTIM